MKTLTLLATWFFVATQSFSQFTQLTSTALEGGNANSYAVQAGVVFAATSAGVYKTSNNGTSWTYSSNGIFSSLGTVEARSIAANASGGYISTGSGIGKSTDGGATWTAAVTGLPTDYWLPSALVANGANLYVVVADHGTSMTHIYYSTNNAASWTQGAVVNQNFALFSAGSAVYYIDSDNDEIGTTIGSDTTSILIPEAGLSPGDGWEGLTGDDDFIFLNEAGEKLYRLDLASPSSWTNLTGFLASGAQFVSTPLFQNDTVFCSALIPFPFDIVIKRSHNNGLIWSDVTPSGPSVPFMEGGVVVGPGKVMINFLDNGIWYSGNNGNAFASANSGLRATTHDNLIASDAAMITTTQIEGPRRSADGGSTWLPSTSGIVAPLTLIFTNFAFSTGNAFYLDAVTNIATFQGQQYKSTNDGASWTVVAYPGGVNDFNFAGSYGDHLVGISYDPTYDVFVSTNAGTSWTSILTTLPDSLTINGGEIEGFGGHNDKLFVYGTKGSGNIDMYLSDNNGATWNSATGGLPTWGWFNGYDGNNGYMPAFNSPADGKGWVSLSFGNSDSLYNWDGTRWTAYTDPDMCVPTYSIGYLDDGLDESVYVSNYNGVHLNFNASANWDLVQANLHDGVFPVTFAFANGKVYGGTYGAGIWEQPLLNTVGIGEKGEQLLASKMYPNPASYSLNILTIGAGISEISVVNLLGQEVAVQPVHNTTNIQSLDVSVWQNGIYLVMLKDKGGKVLNTERLVVRH